MNARTQITLDPDMQRRAQKRAEDLGISFTEYVRRIIARDLGPEPKQDFDITTIFDLVDTGEPTDIARDKDKMIGEAVWQEYLRDTGQSKRKARRRERS